MKLESSHKINYNILNLEVLISLMINMNIFVIHTYDITIILEFHILNMQLSRLQVEKNCLQSRKNPTK
jgi:hypothetical protein